MRLTGRGGWWEDDGCWGSDEEDVEGNMRKETLGVKMIRNRGKQMKEMWKPGEREVETVEAIWMVAMTEDTATDDTFDADGDHGNGHDDDDADHHRRHHLDLDRGTCKAHCSN